MTAGSWLSPSNMQREPTQLTSWIVASLAILANGCNITQLIQLTPEYLFWLISIPNCITKGTNDPENSSLNVCLAYCISPLACYRNDLFGDEFVSKLFHHIIQFTLSSRYCFSRDCMHSLRLKSRWSRIPCVTKKPLNENCDLRQEYGRFLGSPMTEDCQQPNQQLLRRYSPADPTTVFLEYVLRASTNHLKVIMNFLTRCHPGVLRTGDAQRKANVICFAIKVSQCNIWLIHAR
mmetsp:Transcript_70932/g.125382  ORF Transcript_70932/g.125382 Transcript_70932/m.125382 type:complete len:235 (-) Transcript_70932:174-878(-)